MPSLLARIAAALLSTLPAHAGAELGVHAGSDTNVHKAIEPLRALGVRWVRLWADVDWEQPAEHSSFQQARDFHAAGFRVILELSCHETKKLSDPAAVRAWCDWVLTVPGMKEAVDIWEIGNEINVERYWPGTPEQYVELLLQPAWESFHPQGEKVLGSSFTVYQENNKLSTARTARAVAAGYLDYCDYAGLHPYTHTPREAEIFMREIETLYGRKPIIITEWNLKQSKDPAQRGAWAQRRAMQEEAWGSLRERADVICYYRLLESEREGGWPGLLKKDYTPQRPFYEMFLGWSQPPRSK